jgi:hypothetical protein
MIGGMDDPRRRFRIRRARTTKTSPLHRELTELGAVFLAAAGAHVVVTAIGGHGFGPAILVALGFVIIIAVATHRRWTSRPRTPPTTASREESALWLVRAGIDDRPGRLAVLAGAMAALNCDIRALQVHTGPDGPVDELLIHVPANITIDQLTQAVSNAGCNAVHLMPAEIHDLADPVSRALTHAAWLAHHPDDLPAALASMLSASVGRAQPGIQPDTLAETAMYLADPAGGVLAVHRHAMPFTPTEYARAQALTGVARSHQPDRT